MALLGGRRKSSKSLKVEGLGCTREEGRAMEKGVET